MKWKQGAVAALLGLSSLFFIAGCGDTFRPIATPLPKPAPDPVAGGTAVVVFSGGNAASGTSVQINVSGDSISGQIPLGVNPIYAVIGASVISVNQADSSLSIYSTALGNFISSATSPPALTTVSLPGDAQPVFAVTAAGNTYVAFSGSNHHSVGIVNSSNAFVGELTVGQNPTALVALPNGSKVYALNQGSNNVSVINSDNSAGATIAVGTTPVYGVASADSTRVYILNRADGTVSVIDTGSDTVIAPPVTPSPPDPLLTHATLHVGTAPSFAIYDSQLKHVYVTNATSGTLSVIDADAVSPNVNKNIAEIQLQGITPKSVTVLPNTTKIYVANSGSGTVSVINTLSNQVVKTIAVGGQPISIAASSDSAKVVVANAAGYVSMISTASDSETMRVNGPAGQTPVIVGVI